MHRTTTERGFTLYTGYDTYGEQYTVQESSSVEPRVWVGATYTDRAHLDPEQARDLGELLVAFADTHRLGLKEPSDG